jgi:hypothetical protein
MSKRIRAADVPEFDAAHYLDSENAIAAYLTGHPPSQRCSFISGGTGRHRSRSRHDGDRQGGRDQSGSPLQSLAPG